MLALAAEKQHLLNFLAFPRPTVKSIKFAINAWIEVDDCKNPPPTSGSPDTTDDGMQRTFTSYIGGESDSEVVLVTVHGGDHTWPGQESVTAMIGKSTRYINPNDMKWDVFFRHRRPGSFSVET